MSKMFGTGELTQSCKNRLPLFQDLLLKIVFSTITNIRQFSYAPFIHWQSVDDMRELVKLVPDSVRLSMPLARLNYSPTTFQPVSTLLLLFCFINLLNPEL